MDSYIGSSGDDTQTGVVGSLEILQKRVAIQGEEIKALSVQVEREHRRNNLQSWCIFLLIVNLTLIMFAIGWL